MLRPLRVNPRLNPRRKLRRDARVLFEEKTQTRKTWAEVTPAGTFWMYVTFFDPAIDNDPRELETDDVYHKDGVHGLYQSMALGGVRACWTSEQSYNAGEPGVVEYIAAGNGFGPDILEESATIMARPLVLGRGWNPAIELFDRYGGQVTPRSTSNLMPVEHYDARVGPGVAAVKSAASDAYSNRDMGSGILPRYRKSDDRWTEDPAKLDADANR